MILTSHSGLCTERESSETGNPPALPAEVENKNVQLPKPEMMLWMSAMYSSNILIFAFGPFKMEIELQNIWKHFWKTEKCSLCNCFFLEKGSYEEYLYKYKYYRLLNVKYCSQRNRNIFCIWHLQLYINLHVAKHGEKEIQMEHLMWFVKHSVSERPWFSSSVKINLLFVEFWVWRKAITQKSVFFFFHSFFLACLILW